MSDRVGVFEGIDFAAGTDRGYHVVTIGPDATQADVQAFRDAYELGVAWAEAEAALPEGWALTLTSGVPGPAYYATAKAIRVPADPSIVQVPSDTPAAALRALAEKLREARR